MLEFFRRHRGAFLMTLTVIIILSFTVWGGWKRSGLAGVRTADDVAFTIYGKDYSHGELSRLSRMQQMGYLLGMFDLFELEQAAEEVKSRDGGASFDFVGNLLVMRKEAVKYGIAVSDEEAKEKLKSLSRFQKEGKYDPAAAASAEQNLHAYGFTGDDMIQAAKDSITFSKLKEVVGANYSPSPLAVAKSYASKQQTIKASTIQFVLEDFKKKAEVKDDEISKYFEEKKDTYKTAEKRAAAIVYFEKPQADPKAAEEKDEKKKADAAAKLTKDVTEFEKAASDFDLQFKTPGADINKLVAEFNQKQPFLKLKVDTLPLFEKDSPAEQIIAEKKLVDEVFRSSLKAGGHGEPVEGSKGGYYFCKVTQFEAPKQQELKDVKEKIKETLVAQKAQEAMTKAANDARTAINDALKAGKKLDDVLKEKNLKAEALPEFSANNPPPGNPQSQAIAAAAADAPANSVAKSKAPIANDKGEILVVVTAKELRKRDDSESLKKSEETSLASNAKDEMFKSWFGGLRRKAALRVHMN